MKRILILFQLFVFTRSEAQNEFAATAFYNEFRKIYNDGKAGFISCRSVLVKTGFEDLQQEYKSRCMLPLADSGKVIIPHSAKPYVVYFFEPDKIRLKVDQRALNLREAVITAFDQPLYSRAETFLVNDYPFTRTLFFTNPEQETYQDALFVSSIYFYTGKYFLSFEIKGQREKLE